MDYTCENCKSRNTWDCEDYWGRRCENFTLDVNTLSEEEQKMFRMLQEIMRENDK